MKEISIKIEDELYRQASSKIADLEAEISQYVAEYLETINRDDDALLSARTHMRELFAGVREQVRAKRVADEDLDIRLESAVKEIRNQGPA